MRFRGAFFAFLTVAAGCVCVLLTPAAPEGEPENPTEAVSVSVAQEETPQELSELYAQSAVLMDADSGRVLFAKNGDEVRAMASTTKIMTCILALEHMTDGQTMAASEEAASQPKVRLGVTAGETFYVRDLLYALMLESYNDAAVIVAEAIAGSTEKFAAMMNEKAEEIGCTDTHFVTPNGLDAEDAGGKHATTAKDLARILRYCIMESEEKEEFLSVTRTESYAFSDTSGAYSYSCSNHNAFLTMMDGALTGKTGFTADAGYCYVGALRDGERTFICALLACGWPNNRNYKWKDTRALMEYALAHYEYRKVWEEPECPEITVTEAANAANPFSSSVALATRLKNPDRDLRVLLREDETVETKLEVKNTLSAPVSAGRQVGTYRLLLNGEAIGEYPLVTSGAAEKRTLTWCAERILQDFLFVVS